jgi:hypothetical protein
MTLYQFRYQFRYHLFTHTRVFFGGGIMGIGGGSGGRKWVGGAWKEKREGGGQGLSSVYAHKGL